MKAIKLLGAEFLKLKYLPVFWLFILIPFSVLGIVVLAHVLDGANIARLGNNPWRKLFFSGNAILSVFLIIPFSFLFISAAVYLEHQTNAWKYLYTVPTQRSTIYLTKLVSFLTIIIANILVIFIGLILSGYLLNIFFPEMEFSYYPVPVLTELKSSFHIFLSALGIIGFHYSLSHMFKGFLIPASIGVVGFILGFILGTLNKSVALLVPYCYPMIYKDHSMFKIDDINIVDYGPINSVEFYSVLWFVVCIAIGLMLERRKHV